MATGSQKVKTPTGWNSTRGAWVKTASNTWKDVDQIYIKTPSGWNNASGQEATQIPYPYIANAQNPFIRDAQQPYPYIANAQNPVIRDAQQPYPYIANAQSPYIAQGRQPSTYQHRSPLIYQNPVSAQQPNIRDSQEPNIRAAQEPNIRNARQPFTYNFRSPGTYRSPVSYQLPFTYNYRSPFTYRNPVTYQLPFTYNYRSPFTYRNPVGYQLPFTYQHRVPFTYRNPVNGRQPNIRNGQTPFTYQNRQPAIVQSPRNGQQPAIKAGIAQQPYPYLAPSPSPGGGGGGCFTAGTLVWMGDGSHWPIENVGIGDIVYGFNFDTNLHERVEVTELMEPRVCEVYKLSLSNGGWLNVTGGHPFYVEDIGWKVISMEDWHVEVEAGHTHFDADAIMGELNIDEALRDANNIITGQKLNESLVKSIEKVEEQTVYHFRVDSKHHNFYANNLLVHNFDSKGVYNPDAV